MTALITHSTSDTAATPFHSHRRTRLTAALYQHGGAAKRCWPGCGVGDVGGSRQAFDAAPASTVSSSPVGRSSGAMPCMPMLLLFRNSAPLPSSSFRDGDGY